MRIIQKIDENGYKHLYYIKDIDLDTAKGIPADPPNINELDWDAIKREIHNALIDARLIQLQNIRRSNSGLDNILLKPIKRRLIELYRSIENG